MIDVPSIYNDPIISRKRLGTPIQPYVKIKESITVDKHRAILTEIPNKYERVKVTGRGVEWHESKDRELKENTFWVDYNNGVVYFHESVNNITLTFEYLGEGVFLFPDSRVYHTGDKKFPTIKDKISDIDRAILVERHRIDEQILSHPQPSEVVDMRIDYNGKIYRVAKDRIDAEQRKIEEAYVDAKGVKYNSLKERIDSLQLATESQFDDIGNEITSIWSEVNLIPGKIELEVGRLEKDLDEYVQLLQSQIDLVPEQIQLKVQELKEYVDGELDYSYSLINMLSDQIELKVDKNGVVSAINLSPEGVRISGNKVWITGETRIDNAVIKSAHIDSISADKITAGTINADEIGIQGGTPTEYIRLIGNRLEIRGQVESTWFGQTKKRDIKYQFQNGYFRARNDAEDKSLYFTDYGIHSFIRGFDEEDPNAINHGSGVIEFFSHEWDGSGIRGIRIFSNRGSVGIQTNYRDIHLDSARDIIVKAKNYILINGTNLRAQAIGVPNPYTNFYIGANGDKDGELRVTDRNFYNDGNTRYLDVRARYYRGRAVIDRTTSSYLYLGSDLGVRVTSRGINNISNIVYRPIQASAFQVRSSRESKENIRLFDGSGLDVINDLSVVNYNYKGEKELNIGFISEDSLSIAGDDGKFIDLNKLTAYLTKAVQELSQEVKELRRQLKLKSAEEGY